MPGRSDDKAVQSAHSAFSHTASQRLKRLIAEGVDSGAASSRLFDDLLPAEAGGRSAGAASPTLRHVMERTGSSPAQASKVLQLKEEIGRLRGEGHSTAALIEKLQRRLRDAGGQRRSGKDENGEQAAARRTPGSAQAKKRRMGDGDAITSFTPSRLQELPDEYDFGCGYNVQPAQTQMDRPPSNEKRHREEGAPHLGSPLSQLKKLKLRPPVPPDEP